ncbi:NrsF family protein [Rhodoferax sp.]|uniref:NrsF family protein n=1 Tax=Rhodoferax sp. TaxID=50421 RepID=UPI00374D2F7C
MATEKNSSEVMRTVELIQTLSLHAGKKRPARLSFDRALSLSVALSLATALWIVMWVPGIRAGISELVMTLAFQFKVISMSLLFIGGCLLIRATGTPGAKLKPIQYLSPGFLFLVAGMLLDTSAYPWLGASQKSVPICVGAIVLASFPGFFFILAGLRRGIPTRLRFSGALAGFLSGAIGALGYTISCVNDGAAFVAIWYLTAIALMTGIGAILGPRALKW